MVDIKLFSIGQKPLGTIKAAQQCLTKMMEETTVNKLDRTVADNNIINDFFVANMISG